MGSIAAGTIVAKNYLPFARVLADSFSRHHPDIPFFMLLADEPEGCFDPSLETFQVLRLEDLGISDLRRFCFHYSRQEAVVAAKPYFLTCLLDLGFRSAVFLDADMLILNSMTPLLSVIHDSSVMLMPHLLNPPAGDAPFTRELNILISGVFNGGFVGVTGTAETRQFLTWWRNRLFDHCLHSVGEGMHYDQRWLDFTPSFIRELQIVRDLDYNVAYWNLHERDLVPCRFFHFSGFDPERPESPTRYYPHLRMSDVGSAARLFSRYAAMLRDAGYDCTRGWPYAFDRFDNGVQIPHTARRKFREMGREANRFGDPFITEPPGSYYRWLNTRLKTCA
jgi:hypothetical protein